MQTAKATAFAELSGDKSCDIAVIGAGLTGITTAVLLAKTGADVAVVEADRVGSGTTGNTTAKITIQHGLKYHTLADDKALAYAAANCAGLHRIASFIDEYGINCDFTRVSSYVYTRKDDEIKNIEKEMASCEKLGLNCKLTTRAELPFRIKAAIVIDGMAQFHPLKYVYALADIFVRNGGRIYEHSKVLELERKNTYVINTEKGRLTAKMVVVATNYPMIDFPGLFFLKLHQERSYIIAANSGSVDIAGMYINAEKPVNSIRMQHEKDRDWLLLGGYGHKTGREDDDKSGYSSLEDFLHDDFIKADQTPAYRWSAQDCMTLDGLPYVGAVSSNDPDVYVATGYEKWGMTNSAAAAMMITDSITGSSMIDKKIRDHFSPMRMTPAASAKNFFIQGAEAISAYTAGNIGIPLGDYDEVPPGKGAVLRIGGKAQAVYRDEDGTVHAYDAHCTHMGCPLEYNEAENSFDCTCHGSRFAMDGTVLEGPAKAPLKRIEEDQS